MAWCRRTISSLLLGRADRRAIGYHENYSYRKTTEPRWATGMGNLTSIAVNKKVCKLPYQWSYTLLHKGVQTPRHKRSINIRIWSTSSLNHKAPTTVDSKMITLFAVSLEIIDWIKGLEPGEERWLMAIFGLQNVEHQLAHRRTECREFQVVNPITWAVSVYCAPSRERRHTFHSLFLIHHSH